MIYEQSDINAIGFGLGPLNLGSSFFIYQKFAII